MVEQIEEQSEPAFEIPEDFDVQENEDGSADVLPKESPKIETDTPEFYENLATKIDQKILDGLSIDYLQYVEVDKKAREQRDKQYADAIRRSGLGDDAPGGAEFEGASKVVHPLIAEAAIDFASAAIKELFPADGPVKTKVEGKSTPEKLQKADRKKRHMNWQLRTKIKEFKPALEQLLTQVPMGGVQYTKMYFSDQLRRPKFEFIPLDDVFVPYHATSFYSVDRKTHRQKITKIEFEERVGGGLYIDPEVSAYSDSVDQEESASKKANDKVEGKEKVEYYDEDGLRTIYEVYCYLKFDEDKYAKSNSGYAPYIMMIDEISERVIGLYRNWDNDLDDVTYEPLDWLVEWPFIPWRGAYAIGLDNIIGSLSAAATGALRALLDSAHVNNAPTAMKLKGAQMSGQSANIAVTQIFEIDAAPGVDDIRKIAMPLPFNPPSTVLFQLLGFVVDAAKGIVRTAIETNTEYSPNMMPGTQMMQIEQGMKVYSAIHGRMHNAMEKVLCILHRLNRDHLEDEFPPENEEHATDLVDEFNDALAYRSDYQGEIDVQPISDPNIFSEAQRYAQMGGVGQLIMQAPQLYNIRAWHKSMLQLMKVPNIDELLPDPEGIKDENPATENIKMATGNLASALPDQDHLAHLQTHIDFYSNAVYGQNPAIKPKLAAAWLSHVIQHMLLLYGAEIKDLIEKTSGKSAKEFMSEDPSVREALSKAVAAASPLALGRTDGLLAKLMPMIAEAMQYVQSIQPPAPQDPTQVAAMQVQSQAQLGHAKLQQEAQKTQVDTQQKQQSEQIKAQIKQAEISSKEKIAQLDNATEAHKNSEDNQTALQLAHMRLMEGKNVGNLKNGNSLDQNYSNGGLVTSDQGDKNG